MASTLTSFLLLKGDLPAGVHDYPTLKGKLRFDALVTFNWFVVGYILIHKLIAPLILLLGQTASNKHTEFGFWYLYHLILGLWLVYRKPERAFYIVYLAWFGVGLLPWMILGCLYEEGHWMIRWLTISGLLTYGSSFVLTLFLLYRMRMPTTAFLFQLKERIIPKWKYAIPYFSVGTLIGFYLFILGIHV